MRTLLLVLLFTVGGLLSGCVTTTDDNGLERMQRNHNAAVESAA